MTWNDNIPLITNVVAEDLTDINENLTYLLARDGYRCDAAEVDQGAAGSGNSLKDLIDAIGTSKQATIILPHSGSGNTTTYVLGTAETVPPNIYLKPEPGALIQPATGITLTVYSPEHIIASPGQQIVDMTNNSVDPFEFTAGGKAVYPDWWEENTTPGTTDMSDAINACAAAAKPSLTPVKFLASIYYVTESLDFTEANQNALSDKREYWQVSGEGQMSTILKVALSEAYPVVDTTGSHGIILKDFGIYNYSDTGLQTAGVLCAYSATNTRGTKPTLKNMLIRGYFNGGAAFVSSGSDDVNLNESLFYNLEGDAAVVFTSEDVSGGVTYLTATVDSKFSTIGAPAGNITKIRTSKCSFNGYSGAATVIYGYRDWIDFGSYWALQGSATKAVHFFGLSGGSALHFYGIRMECNHSSADTVGIYIDAAGSGRLLNSEISGYINSDTNDSIAIQNNYTDPIDTSIINVNKETGYTSALIDGDIRRSVIFKSFTNHDITNSTSASGGNIILGDNNTGNWISADSDYYYKTSTSNARRYDGIARGGRYARIGSSTTYGIQGGAIAYSTGAGTATTATVGEETLETYELPALDQPSGQVDQVFIRVEAFGKVAANANAKAIAMYAVWNNDGVPTEYTLVSNDVTGSPNNLGWVARATIRNFYMIGEMTVGATIQTAKHNQFGGFDYTDDTITFEIRATAGDGDVTLSRFTVTVD